MPEKDPTPARLNHPVTRLQIFRVAAGMTQVDLAQAAKCSVATITHLERRPPHKVFEKNAKAIAAALGVDVFEIFPPDLIASSNLPHIRAAILANTKEKRYRAAHLEEIRAKDRARAKRYRAAHREEIRAKDRARAEDPHGRA